MWLSRVSPVDGRDHGRWRIVPALTLCAALLAGCQQMGSGGSGSLIGGQYNLFFTQDDHVKELLAANKVVQASEVYTREARYFLGKGAAHDALLADLKRRVEDHFALRNDAVVKKLNGIQWPSPGADWPAVKARIAEADNLIERQGRHRILEWRGRSTVGRDLRARVDALRERVEDGALDAFLDHGPLAEPAFEDVYPVAVQPKDLFAAIDDRFGEIIAAYSPDRLLGLSARYAESLSDVQKIALARRFVILKSDADMAGGEDGRLERLLMALAEAKRADLAVPDDMIARIRVVDISSRTLVTADQLEFPVELKSDLPIRFETAELDDALPVDANADEDAIILVDVAAAKLRRDIDRYVPVASEKKIGSQSVQNPAYAGAQNGVTQAQMTLQQRQMQKIQIDGQYCDGLACIAKAAGQIAATIQSRKAREALEQAMATLSATPMMVEKPIFATYKFRKAAVEARKTAIVNYYIVDRRRQVVFRDSFDAVETRNFEVAYGIDSEDRHRTRHLGDFDAESDVASFEGAAMVVTVDDLMRQFFEQRKKAERLPDLVTLRREIVEAKNIVLAEFQADRVRSAPATAFADLAQSVVAIFSPDGKSIGSGFYVNDDLVLSNQHVVDGTKYVEIKLRNGLETFGKVIAVDVRRDLALVRVEARGVPVGFFVGNELPVGETVVAIGHPNGLEFSASRGIVSAVREMRSRRVGGRKAWHVQTDAAINPGNSGGPLFLDGAVVGVNTWRFGEMSDTGLNFALHYKEAIEFLRENDVSVRRGRTGAGES